MLCVLCLTAGAQELPVPLRTNGGTTLDALSLLDAVAKPSVVQVLNDKGQCIQLGVAVTDDGYILTKASEAGDADHLIIAWSDGRQSEATVVLMDRSMDLLLARTAHEGALPISWSTKTDCDMGEWMTAFSTVGSAKMSLRLGNISAHAREIPGRGGALGVEMSDDHAEDAVRIMDVGTDSPAESAGIKPDDVIVAIDDQKATSIDVIYAGISHRQPGEMVKLRIRRGKNEQDCSVRLASRSKIESNWTGEDYANGGVSLRTDNFSKVMQLQMPLSPHDMGGPLLDLDGKAVGITIARVDRVTTFALPVSVFWGKVQQWIIQDRRALAPLEAKR